MNLAQRLRVRIADHQIVQRFDLRSSYLHHIEVVIHNRVDQCLEQGTRPRNAAGVPSPPTKMITYWVEDIRAVFLEGPHNVPSADPTHLFDEDILSVSHREHLSHEEQGSLILVEFRPLIGVGNVFEAQGMEREPLPEGFQTFHLVDAPRQLPR